jgi:hypothetical protein
MSVSGDRFHKRRFVLHDDIKFAVFRSTSQAQPLLPSFPTPLNLSTVSGMQDAPNDILSLALLYRDALESEEGVGSLPQLLVQPCWWRSCWSL